MKKTKQKLYTVQEYADLCGVSRAAIYQRLTLGTMTATKVTNGRYSALAVDANEFPPEQRKAGRKPFRIK